MASVSAYTTSSGRTRYRVRYRLPDGRSTDARGFLTKQAAVNHAHQVEVDKGRGKLVSHSAGRTTVGAVAEQWFASKVNLKPSAKDRYRQSLERQVLPRWGNVPVSKVTTTAVQEWINDLTHAYSPSVVVKARGALRMILDVAVRDLRITVNPAVGTTVPRTRSNDHVYLTASEVFSLSEHAGHGELVVLVLAFTGLRWGEMAALKERRWDSQRKRLRIVESVADVNGVLEWGTPKTHQQRSVPAPAWLAERIDVAASGLRPDDLLFPSAGGGVMRNQNARRDWFDKAVRDSAIPRITPHDLRHTAASLAISSGANVKAVQRMLGHKSASMTLDTYAGLFEDDLDDVASRMPSPPAIADVTELRTRRG